MSRYKLVYPPHTHSSPLRLVGPTGAPLVARQLMGLKLSAVWALMVAFDRPLPADFEGVPLVEGGEGEFLGGQHTIG